MTTRTVDQLVEDYLARLELAARPLPADRRAELLEGIAEHIDEARSAGGASGEAELRTLLDRLGDPEEIVAAAMEDGVPSWAPAPSPPAPSPLVAHAPSTAQETAAVAFLTVGSLLPILGWLVGAALLWSSSRWTTREKLLGTLVVPGGPGLVLLAGMLIPVQTCTASLGGPESCSGFALPPQVGIPLLLLAVIGPIVVAGLLYTRARRRAALEPPVLRQPSYQSWGGLEIAAVLLLSVGSFLLPVIGPLTGLVLAYLSERWTAREKGIATALALAPVILLLVLLVLFYFARIGV